jgi:hypothetical protein
MNRSELGAALGFVGDAPVSAAWPGGQRAVIAMLERHACRLDQVPSPARANAEALARALRAAQRLYDLAAVTIGDGGDLLTDAARTVGGTRAGGTGAGAADGAVDPGQVLAAPAVAVAQDAFERLRAVLGGRAGIVVVLPAPARLVAEAGLAPGAGAALLLAALHFFGPAEPDAFVLTGSAGPADPSQDAAAGFYGAALLRVGTGRGAQVTAGVAVRPGLDPGGGYGVEAVVVTSAEINPALTPAEVRARLAAARGTVAADDAAATTRPAVGR